MADSAPADDDLEGYRSYLRLLGRMQIRGRMQAKVDLSGLVQQTLVEANGCREEWEGLPEDRRVAWLRTAFANNLRDEVRRFRTRARDVERERPIVSGIEDSASRIEDWVAGDVSSPSARAIRREDAIRLAEALERLPEDQRTAVELQHLQQVPIAEIARQMERSKPAVAMLVYRGIKRLREILTDEPR